MHMQPPHLPSRALRVGLSALVVAGLVACATPIPSTTAQPAQPAQPATPPTPIPPPAAPRAAGFVQPAKGQIVGRFDGTHNKGLDIAGNLGDAVIASRNGRVVLVTNELRGYGTMVVLKHDETFITAYAHIDNVIVKEGDMVKQGQKIAELGESDSDRVELHFEIRKQGVAIDPQPYLNGDLR